VLSRRNRALFWCPEQSWHLQVAYNGLCFQSTSTSCETCRQEAGSSRKLTLECKAQLGVAPENHFFHSETYFISSGVVSFFILTPSMFYGN
jgi:hypothetical protein